MLAKTILLLSLLAGSTAAETVSIVDADPNNGIKFTTIGNSVSLPIYLELDQGKVTGLHVVVDTFVGPDGLLVPVTATLNGAAASTPIDITQQDRPEVQISATLPGAGDYKSHISLSYADKRQKSIPITVTRVRNALPIQIEGLNTVAVTRWFNAPSVTVDFVIRETGGQSANLYWPTLVGFALKEADKKRQASYDTNRFEIADEKGSIHIGGQASISGKLMVIGIRGVGEYSAKIRVSSPDTNPVDGDLSILVRDNWLVAFFFILVGGAISYVIRRYTKESRPKLVALRTLADIGDALGKLRLSIGQLPDREKGVFDGLRDQITEVDRDLTRGTTPDFGATALKDLQEKLVFLPKWLNVGRHLRSVNPPSLAATPNAEWEALADSYFLKKVAGPAPENDLNAISSDIDKAVKDDLMGRIAAFQQAADGHKMNQPATSNAIDSSVLPLLSKAKGEATNDRLLEATITLQDARLAYGRILAQQLIAEFGGPTPFGFKDEEWRVLSQPLAAKLEAVLKESDAEAILSEFEVVNQAYIMALIEAMGRVIVTSKAKLASGVLAPGIITILEPKLEDAEKALETGKTALQTGETGAARKSYQQVADALREISNTIQRGGVGTMSFSLSDVVPSLMTMPTRAGVQQMSDVPAPQMRQMSRPEKFTLLLDTYDLWFNVAILLVATVVGLNVLWASDPVWGGWKAYITALVWGLGLQQAGGATQDGLAAVVKKVTE